MKKKAGEYLDRAEQLKKILKDFEGSRSNLPCP